MSIVLVVFICIMGGTIKPVKSLNSQNLPVFFCLDKLQLRCLSGFCIVGLTFLAEIS
jgi:hypothetical protein